MPRPRSKLYGRVKLNSDRTKYVCLRCGIERCTTAMNTHVARNDCVAGRMSGHSRAQPSADDLAAAAREYEAAFHRPPPTQHEIDIVNTDFLTVNWLPMDFFERPSVAAWFSAVQIHACPSLHKGLP
ncbi:hypothetical protein GGF32_007367 [Allomyces javanicus]|nr:hypothetical protein GGF32_007367 [Allomyces javanicus]